MAAAAPEVVVRGNAAGFSQSIRAGLHELASDEPLDQGGAGTGPSPYELLAAALGACTSMTLGMYARRKQWPLDDVQVRLRHSRIYAEDCADCDTKDGMLDRIDRDIELAGNLTAEQRARLVEIADLCPVHRTLTRGMQIHTRLV
jgi:putative redox protein